MIQQKVKKVRKTKRPVIVDLVYMQYNISDSQALFQCFVLIILRMASLGTLFLHFVGQQVWLRS